MQSKYRKQCPAAGGVKCCQKMGEKRVSGWQATSGKQERVNMAFERKSKAKLTPLVARLSAGLVFILLGVSMSADAGLFGYGGTSWMEEVLLHDGQKLIVERSQTYGGYAEPASRERSLAEEQWMFQKPGSGQRVAASPDQTRSG